MPYYPQHRFILGLTLVRRERRLPSGAIGEVMVQDHVPVEANTVVLRGAVSGEFLILNALEPLGLRRPDELTEDLFIAKSGDVVDRGQVIAQKGEGRRAKTLKAPIRAVLSRIEYESGRVILQVNPEPVEVAAMCPGMVTSVRGTNEVLIETSGALIQCAWGNGKSAYSQYRVEPEEGIESLDSNSLLQQWRGTAIIMKKPILSSKVFSIAAELEMTGIIAPSMRSDLREAALRQQLPVILTEGFGDQQMSEMVYNLLLDNQGRPALIDATEPERWSSSRPEIIIPLPSGGALPPTPEANLPLAEGSVVRITRSPYAGMSGRVRRISDIPRAVGNGLRLPGADVQLSSGRTVFVPLANLELVGRLGDAPGTG
jgi:hypothetical protein